MSSKPVEDQHSDNSDLSLLSSDVTELCRLIVGLSPKEIQELRRHFEDPNLFALDIAKVLPDAFRLSTANDDRLSKNLRPLVEGGIQESIRKDPEKITNVLTPIMWPAIRAAISASMRENLESVNRMLEYRFSFRSILWRFQAWRKGVSFGEVALLNLYEYRIEHLFLIHKEDGILLCEASRDKSLEHGDAIGGMLTAIRDFVRDSFDVASDAKLRSFEVGTLEVIISDSQQASLAAVVRGTPPSEFREELRKTLDRFQLGFSSQLESFKGDTEPFSSFEGDLEVLLQAKSREGSSKAGLSWGKLGLFFLIIASPFIFSAYYYFSTQSEWNHFVRKLHAQPGIIVTESSRSISHYSVEGLRDPRAIDPMSLLDSETDFDSDKITAVFGSYLALDWEIVRERINETLSPPSSVRLEMPRVGHVRVVGEADQEWIDRFADGARLIPGVDTIDVSGLFDSEMEEFTRLVEDIMNTAIHFSVDNSQISTVIQESESNKARTVHNQIIRLFELSHSVKQRVIVELHSHGSELNTDAGNRALAETRTKLVKRTLEKFGVPSKYLRAAEWKQDLDLCKFSISDCEVKSPRVVFIVRTSPIQGAVS